MAKPVKCERCGRENDPSFTFCLDCGQRLKPEAVERTCANCGAKVQVGFRFCGHCGRAVEAASPAPTGSGTAPAGPPAAPAQRRSGSHPAGGRPAPSRAAAPQVTPPRPQPATGTVTESPDQRTPFPSGGAYPRLATVRPDGLPGFVFPLDREETVCGRTFGDVLLSDDPTVSPRHARFTVGDGHIRLEDLGSVAGTFLRLRSPRPLAVGDEFRVGRQLLRLEPLPREAPAGSGVTPWGSPDPGFRMRLAQLLEGGGLGEIFPLRAGENVIGREAGDVVFPADRYVSGRHARIDVAEGSVTLTDLGSSNGTFYKISGAVDLQPGDQLLLGRQLLRVEP